MTDRKANSDALSYEQAREELIVIVQRLESGGVPLGESLALWERGEQLGSHVPGLAGRREGQNRGFSNAGAGKSGGNLRRRSQGAGRQRADEASNAP